MISRNFGNFLIFFGSLGAGRGWMDVDSFTPKAPLFMLGTQIKWQGVSSTGASCFKWHRKDINGAE
jgi:hypothetical protein